MVVGFLWEFKKKWKLFVFLLMEFKIIKESKSRRIEELGKFWVLLDDG